MPVKLAKPEYVNTRGFYITLLLLSQRVLRRIKVHIKERIAVDTVNLETPDQLCFAFFNILWQKGHSTLTVRFSLIDSTIVTYPNEINI